MGCGQSKIHLYPRKSKSKANGKKGGHADSDAETDEDEGHVEESEKLQNRDRDKKDETDEHSNKDTQESDEDVSVSLLRAKNLSLLQSQEISTSQQNFFRMLDKKIEEGPDYDSASETEIALEEARLNALVQHWESASLTASICSSASRSLQTTPVRQVPLAKQLTLQRSMLLQTGVVVASPLPQQVLNASEFLPHGNIVSSTQSAAAQQLPAGPLKHLQGPTQQQQQQQQMQQQQQLVIAHHMNTKMLQQHHQLATMAPQMSAMSMASSVPLTPPETSATTANTSNALALMQAPNLSPQLQQQQQHQQYAHMLNLPGASQSQLMGKPPNASPKRLMDTRLLMNPSPLAQQMQSQLQSQYMPATSAPAATASGGYMNGARPTAQPPISMQMSYYGQPTAQQSLQVISSQHDPQQAIPQGQNQQYYGGEVMHSVQPPTEYRFPPAISVQRLAPQVQRQLRETQELIKDSCPQLYAAGYGSPGPPPIRNQARNPNRRPPTLETQFSQELS